ncbi:MAG: hypothetical protein UY73_C0045G0004 [Parcubacteria group bacterium GW2011_GWA2_52_8]|nr:MAG: hypothetical protein UY73_C0045G0004 [Parcubacteria group bacterium GW2011_GWA2_52_8]
MSEYFLSGAVDLDAKNSIRQSLGYFAFHFNGLLACVPLRLPEFVWSGMIYQDKKILLLTR